MKRLRIVGAVLAVAGLALVLVPGRAEAAALRQSAWWSRATTTAPVTDTPLPAAGVNPTVPVAAPGPPNVTAEQLHVEGTAAGATAIAGFTYDLAKGESGPILSLTPAAGSAVPPNAVILACLAAIEWTAPAASPGPWESKPLADCTTSVVGQIVEGGPVVFPLQPLQQGTSLDVVIVPGTIPELPAGANGSVFSVTFERPGPDALATTPGRSSTDEEDFDFDFDFDEDFSFEPVTEPFDDFVAPEPVATFDDFVLPVAAPVVAPALDPQDQAPTVPRSAVPAAVVLPDAASAARTLGFVMLVVGAVTAFLTPAEAPADTAVMGLGRFRRARPLTVASADGVVEERGVARLRRVRVGRPPAL